MHCPNCQNEPPSDSAFCNRCGSPLPDVPVAGERRYLSIVFCDMVGSTELSQLLDAEELSVLIAAYQNVSARVIRSYDGHIAQYLGDGLLVYFGYPQAHDDDAIRAVSAGLEILSQVPAMNASIGQQLPAHRIELELRVGVHSGPVVLSDMGRGDDQPVIGTGDTVNIAARLQNLARPGTLILSDATERLVTGAFVLEDLGPVSLRGVAKPVPVHRAVSSSGVEGRVQRQAIGGLTPLVGRSHELALVGERWEESKSRRGQVVLLSGEPGIGKSRIVQAVHERVGTEGLTWLECRCSARHENSAFHPVADMLEQVLGIEDEDPGSMRHAKLEATLQAADLTEEHFAPLANLLSVPEAAPQRPADATTAAGGENPREQLLESLIACVLKLCSAQPLVLVFEDLHWSDPSTLELLDRLIHRAKDQRLLLILTFRPEFQAKWDAGTNLVRIDFYPLTREQIAALCNAVAGRALPEQLVNQLVAHTDGVPLFAEELTKAVLEADLLEERDDRLVLTRPVGELRIPSTLAESLMARLDRLGVAKKLAQRCAVIGRDVSYELLRAVSDESDAELRAGLDQLVSANLLAQDEAAEKARYAFRHAMIQNTAYGSLLRADRKQLHARIARTLEEQFAERAATHPEDLAQHYNQAGEPANAVRFYQRAAEQAIHRLAHIEALGHIEQAIELIEQFEDRKEWDRTELELQVALGTSTMIARGQGHPDVERAHARARDLSGTLGDRTGLFRALWGLSRFHQSQGQPVSSYELGEQMLELARQDEDPSQLCWAHLVLGQAQFWRGDPRRAAEEFEATIGFCDASPTPPEVHIYGQDPLLTSQSLIGPSLWLLSTLR